MSIVVKMLAAYLLYFSQQVAADCEMDRLAALGRPSQIWPTVNSVPKGEWVPEAPVVIIVNNMPHISQAWAAATAWHIVNAPLLDGKLGFTYEALLMLSWAEKESNYKDPMIGDSGASHCSMQIYIPNGLTKEGWTGEQLRQDPFKCISSARAIMKTSFSVNPDHPMAMYAGDRKLSDARLQLVKKMVTEFPSIDMLVEWAWISDLVGSASLYEVPTTD